MPTAAEKWRPKFSEQLTQSAEDKKLKGRRKLAIVPSPKPRAIEMRVSPTLTEQFVGYPFNMGVRSSMLDAGMREANLRLTPGERLVSFEQRMDTHGNIIMKAITTMQQLTNDVWNDWNIQRLSSDSGVTFYTGFSGDTWSTGSSAASMTVWRQWVDIPTGMPVRVGWDQRYGVQVAESEERKKQRVDAEERYRAEAAARDLRYKEEEKKWAEARETAMKLLISCLNQQQRNDLKNNRFFYVEAASGRLYRIDQGTAGNVKVVDRRTKAWIESLCIHPDNVPEGDTMLMQKMMIETAEEVFRSHANISLRDGNVIRGEHGVLDSDRMAQVIPISRKAA